MHNQSAPWSTIFLFPWDYKHQADSLSLVLFGIIPRLHKRPLRPILIVLGPHVLDADLHPLLREKYVLLLELVGAAGGEFAGIEVDLCGREQKGGVSVWD